GESRDKLREVSEFDSSVSEGVPKDGWALGIRMKMGRSARRGGRWGKEVDRAAPRERERFVETAYWNPSVVTGADGKAVVKFRAPGALSEYRFTARGVSGHDTLVGQATADLAVRKDFFVDLKVPSAVTEGDRPRFAA